MVVNTNRHTITCNWVSWILLLPTITFQVILIHQLISKGDVNGLILHVIVTVLHIIYAIIKLNTWLFKGEIAQLVNHVFCMNLNWSITMNFLHYWYVFTGVTAVRFTLQSTHFFSESWVIWLMAPVSRSLWPNTKWPKNKRSYWQMRKPIFLYNNQIEG